MSPFLYSLFSPFPSAICQGVHIGAALPLRYPLIRGGPHCGDGDCCLLLSSGKTFGSDDWCRQADAAGMFNGLGKAVGLGCAVRLAGACQASPTSHGIRRSRPRSLVQLRACNNRPRKPSSSVSTELLREPQVPTILTNGPGPCMPGLSTPSCEQAPAITFDVHFIEDIGRRSAL
jgi:hypothetical protein